ncbi:serine carboxypeptidase-like 45 [Cucumis melo var. makuwa]|uniref:Carboxypeptidase n=1 Tax=Cucumis melo var. makuwa TaxID=1194695 RepID=A0A5A7UJE4_CUCMM|nr:serine carboxypeptidase-like 45 [Cucumis melo var. makuwa]
MFRFGECFEGDLIKSLPGQPIVNFKQYGGYITIDELQSRSLFYYFVEAQSDPSSKPLVLWLNGGPGCSSLGAGAFVENGPFRPKGNVLILNEFSWNNVANVLYLESPAGVGFSFSKNTTFYDTVNDKITGEFSDYKCSNIMFINIKKIWICKLLFWVQYLFDTAQDNIVFLERWLEKFPEYKNKEFYITGESYAGHYVPQLARLIVQSKLNIKLKAIAIGNPLLEFNTDFNSRGKYLWSHGVISESTFELLNSVCSISQMIRESINGEISDACFSINDLVSQEMSPFINGYAINLDVCSSGDPTQTALSSLHSLTFTKRLGDDQSNPKPTSSTPLPQFSVHAGKVDVCIVNEIEAYLNRVDVQQALHAQLVGVSSWSLCSELLFVSVIIHIDTNSCLLQSIVNNLVHFSIFENDELLTKFGSGDQDSVIPLLGTRTLVNKLAKAMRLNTTLPYSAWFHNHQVGGWVETFGEKNNLSFATIRGAAHQAPYTSPATSLALFTAFLQAKNP